MNIGIIDYGIGNVYSIKNMIEYIDYACEIVTCDEHFENFDKIILPGVGAYDTALERVDGELKEKIDSFHKSGKHILGICLGAQLLGNSSAEGKKDGLGLIPMDVKSFRGKGKYANIGWKKVQNSFLEMENPRFYHIHNYYMSVEKDAIDVDNLEMASNDGFVFVTGVKSGNVVAVQYHPEKSNDNGKLFFKWFCEL